MAIAHRYIWLVILLALCRPFLLNAQNASVKASRYRKIWYDTSGQLPDSVRLDAGQRLATYYGSNRYDSMLIVCQEMLAYGTKNNLIVWKYTADTHLGKYFWSNGEFRKALAYYQRSASYFDANSTDLLYLKNLVGIGRCYGELQVEDSCFYSLNHALDLALQVRSPYLSNIQASLGFYAFLIRNDYSTALANLMAAQKNKKEHLSTVGIQLPLAELFNTIGLKTQAHACLQEALKNRLTSFNDTLNIYAAIINLRPSMYTLDSVLHQNFIYKRPGGVLSSQTEVWLEAAQMYLDSLQLDQAGVWLDRCSHSPLMQKPKYKAQVQNAQARLFFLQGAAQKAVEICRPNIEVFQHNKLLHRYLPELYGILARCYEKLGRPYLALEILRLKAEEEAKINDQARINQALDLYASLLLQNEKEVSEKNQAIKEELARTSRIYYQKLGWILISICLLLAGALLVYFRLFRQKNIAVKQLELEQKALQQSNQKLQHFSTVISHDVLSNLDFILSLGHVIVGKKTVKTALLTYYESTQKTCHQLKEYCLGLLETAQKKTAPEMTQNAPTDPMPIISRILESYKGPLVAAGFEVRVNPLPPALLPPALIEHFFLNLIGNTLKYGAEVASPLLQIRTCSDAQGRPQWVLENNGPSIPPDQQKSILRGEVQPSASGRGIGLSSLITSMQQHNAVFHLETPDSGGVRCILQLPSSTRPMPFADKTKVH